MLAGMLVTVHSGVIRVELPWDRGERWDLEALLSTASEHGHARLRYAHLASDLQVNKTVLARAH